MAMPSFGVDTIGGTLDYDFTTWLGEGDDHKGTVNEPSRAAGNSVMKKIQSTFKDSGVVDAAADESTTPAEVANTMNKLTDDELFEKLANDITTAIAEVCGGRPSLETLQALPYRPFMGFFGFLIGNLMNPESSKLGTNISPRRLTSA